MKVQNTHLHYDALLSRMFVIFSMLIFFFFLIMSPPTSNYKTPFSLATEMVMCLNVPPQMYLGEKNAFQDTFVM